MYLQGFQESNQVCLFLPAKANIESKIIEDDDFIESFRGAVMEIRRTAGQAA